MSTELALAKAISNPKSDDPDKKKEALAVLEGHDADRPTEDQTSTPTTLSHATSLRTARSKASLYSARSGSSLKSNTKDPQTLTSTEPLPPDAIEKKAAASKLPKAATNGFSAAPEPEDASSHTENGSRTTLNTDGKTDLEAGKSDPKSEDTRSVNRIEKEIDPNIVDWDGPNDPQNPLNWSLALKWSNIAVLSSITFITPLASSMFAPGVPEVMSDFKSNNIQLASFVVSVFILGYAFGPLVIAPLSELHGRLPLYHAGNIGFIIFTIACAVSSNLSMLIGFRFLAGLFGSTPLTIGGGTIADMIVQEKRGGVMALWALGPLLGPVIGPVAGGYLSEGAGWRWVFWVLAILGGIIAIFSFVILCETYPVVLLERKTKRLRKETGNPDLKSKLASDLQTGDYFKLALIRPTKMLLFSPIVFGTSVYMAMAYGYLYLLFTTMTEVFEAEYQFSSGSVGLTYLGIGVGCLSGVAIFGAASDKILKRMSAKGEMKPEYRLPPLLPGSLLMPVGLFLYGWTAEKHVHWIAPIIGTAIVGLGLLATFMPIQTYLVDAFTIYAASAIAANTVFRSLMGALLPLAGRKMYETLGLGWGNSLLGFIALAMSPMAWIFFKYGERIRKSPRFQMKL